MIFIKTVFKGSIVPESSDYSIKKSLFGKLYLQFYDHDEAINLPKEKVKELIDNWKISKEERKNIYVIDAVKGFTGGFYHGEFVEVGCKTIWKTDVEFIKQAFGV